MGQAETPQRLVESGLAPVTHVVGAADMRIARRDGDMVVTDALGGGLAIAMYDPSEVIGGIVCVVLPASPVNPDKAAANPYLFVDTGVPAFLKRLYSAGCQSERLVVKVAGGAVPEGAGEAIDVAGRTLAALRRLLARNGLSISALDTGGRGSRTLRLDVTTGRTWVTSRAGEREL